MQRLPAGSKVYFKSSDSNQLTEIGEVESVVVDETVDDESADWSSLSEPVTITGHCKFTEDAVVVANDDVSFVKYLQSRGRVPCDNYSHVAVVSSILEGKPIPNVKPIVSRRTPGRNDPCPCGSGRKHKKCCMSYAI